MNSELHTMFVKQWMGWPFMTMDKPQKRVRIRPIPENEQLSIPEL